MGSCRLGARTGKRRCGASWPPHLPPTIVCSSGPDWVWGWGGGPASRPTLWRHISGEGMSPTVLPSAGRGAVPQLGGLILGLRGPAEARGPHLLFRRQRRPAAPRLVGSPGCVGAEAAGGVVWEVEPQGPRTPYSPPSHWPHIQPTWPLPGVARPRSEADGRCVLQAPEERVARLRPRRAPADRQLL